MHKLYSLYVYARFRDKKGSYISGTTALFHAVALKSARATETLLQAGAWIDKFPCRGTEIHEASGNGLLEILQMILTDPRITPNDINKEDGCGRTPVYRAAYGGHSECLKLLINKGANLAQVARAKETTMDAIFVSIPRPAEFMGDLLDSKISTNGLMKNNKNFTVTLGE